MAETTRTTSGTSTPMESSSTESGGTRSASNSSSTTSASGSSAAAASRSGYANQTANPGQRSPTQQKEPAPRSSSQGQQQRQGQGRSSQEQHQVEHHDDEHDVERAGKALSDAKKVGAELVGAARDSAVTLIDAQRAHAADQIAAIGEALRHSAESFESTGAGALVDYANQAADQISGFADTVRDRSWSELASDLERFARRYPITFMASAMGLGFVLGRFLMSSSGRTQTASRPGAGHSSGSGIRE